MAWRNPFRVRSLPLISKIYRDGFYFERPTRLKNLCRLILRKSFGILHRFKMGGEGAFDLDIGGMTREIRFSGLNTQFHSLYMRQIPNGTEPQIAGLMDLLVPDDGVFYDVGSNWGYYTLYVGSRPGFRGSLHAFEPMPSTYNDLTSVVRQAGLEQVAKCHNLGVSAGGAIATMVIADGVHSGTASVAGHSQGVVGSGFRVRLAALDELGLPDPSFVKLDVENHEAEAIRGARRVFERTKPMIVFENWLQPGCMSESLESMHALRRLGYRFFLPGWWLSMGGGQFVTPGSNLPVEQLQQLALIPISIAQRLMLSQREDFFACHEDRLSELFRKFRMHDLDAIIDHSMARG